MVSSLHDQTCTSESLNPGPMRVTWRLEHKVIQEILNCGDDYQSLKKNNSEFW